MRRMGWLAAWPAGLVLGVASVLFARSDPDYAFAGSGPAIAAELAAGFALIASGLILARRRPPGRFGVLLATAGCGWFVLEWNNPGVGSPPVFTVGLVCYAAAPPFLTHALLVYPAWAPRLPERAVAAAAYAGSLLALGLLAALVYNPAAQGCSQCPANLLLVHSSAALYRQLNRAGIYVGLAWAVLALGLLVRRLVRSSVALRRQLAPVLAAGCAYLALVTADFAVSVPHGYLSNDPVDRRLWLGEAGAVVVVTLALAWSWLRARRTRGRLARLVVELSAAPSPGALEQALARVLGDPSLRLAYRLADGRHVDADGSQVDPGPASTTLIRGGTEVALLTHKPGLFDDPGLLDALAGTAGLAFEHERLRAELLAQLADLRGSRARIVSAGDNERRRLERDLHDGAQQRLVALTIALGLLRTRLRADPGCDRAVLDRTGHADRELRAALADLRALANGIFPAVLAEEGLAAAVEALAEDVPGRMWITSLPRERLDLAVESAAYRMIAETVRHAGPGPVRVAARTHGGVLIVELDSETIPGGRPDLEDRLGALDGTLEFGDAPGGQVRIRAEIPCGS
jgi:signal transduction histidine kinase